MPSFSIPFAKAHGLGNDFLLVEAPTLSTPDDTAKIGQLAKGLCDRHTGVGADGLVVIGDSASADARFRIFNSDGSEAGLSGNALRCAAAWVLSRKTPTATPGTIVKFETRVGPRTLKFERHSGADWVFLAEIGVPDFRASGVPFTPPQAVLEPIVEIDLPVGDATVRATVLSMGNPQCIVMVEDWALVDWQALGSELERHPWFPDRANVGFVRVLSHDRIEARFWERGAGHTLASGTGSCACAVAAHLARRLSRRAMVQLERGEMEVNWREDGMVELTGPATIVAEGTAHLELPTCD